PHAQDPPRVPLRRARERRGALADAARADGPPQPRRHRRRPDGAPPRPHRRRADGARSRQRRRRPHPLASRPARPPRPCRAATRDLRIPPRTPPPGGVVRVPCLATRASTRQDSVPGGVPRTRVLGEPRGSGRPPQTWPPVRCSCARTATARGRRLRAHARLPRPAITNHPPSPPPPPQPPRPEPGTTPATSHPPEPATTRDVQPRRATPYAGRCSTSGPCPPHAPRRAAHPPASARRLR